MLRKAMLWALLAQALAAYGQDSTRTLIRLQKIAQVGLYVAPEIQAAQFGEKDFTLAAGSSLMAVFNRRLAVGCTFWRTTDASFSPSALSPLYLRAAFGGGRVEWTPKPHKAVHLSIPLAIGRGWANADSLSAHSYWSGHERGDDYFLGYSRNSESWTIVQPGLRLEANLFRFARLWVGADYRMAFASGATSGTLPDNTMRGMAFSAGIKAGFFGYELSKLKRNKQN